LLLRAEPKQQTWTFYNWPDSSVIELGLYALQDGAEQMYLVNLLGLDATWAVELGPLGRAAKLT